MTFQRFSNMHAALAAEEALFEQLASGTTSRAWLMWQGSRALVVPRSFTRLPMFAGAAEESRRRGWPVISRQTGGDVVPQGHGTLNLALAWIESATQQASISRGYAAICDPIRAVVGGSCGSVEAAFCDGAFNIVVAGRKLAGTAQRRRRIGGRSMVLAHAMILVDEDIEADVAATNAFLGNLGDGRVLRAGAHINAVEALGDYALTPARLAARLDERLCDSSCRRELAA